MVIKSNIDLNSFNHVKDMDLIEMLEYLHDGYTGNEDGTPEKNAFGELLGSALDAAVKRPEIVSHFKRSAELPGADEKIKSLYFLVSEQSPTPQNDFSGAWGKVLAYFSKQERRRVNRGGEG